MHEEGILSRLGPDTSIKWLYARIVRREGFLSRIGHTRGLPLPVPRVGLSPLPDALDMDGTTAGIMVARVWQPTALAGRFAGLAACWRRTGVLAPSAARVRNKKGLTVLTLARGEWTSHWPASPQANDRHIAAWQEANGDEQAGRRRSKKTEEAEKYLIFWKKTQQPNLQFQPDRLSAVSGRR
jgi:hypothetical protein